MNAVTLRAHFDGERIVLDESFDLEPDVELIVTIMPSHQEDTEREEGFALAAQMLGRAYHDDEPEYDLSSIKSLTSTM